MLQLELGLVPEQALEQKQRKLPGEQEAAPRGPVLVLVLVELKEWVLLGLELGWWLALQEEEQEQEQYALLLVLLMPSGRPLLELREQMLLAVVLLLAVQLLLLLLLLLLRQQTHRSDPPTAEQNATVPSHPTLFRCEDEVPPTAHRSVVHVLTECSVPR